GRDVAQIEADAGHDAMLQRVAVDRRSLLAEMARRVDVGAAVVGHREEHHAVAVNVAGIGERLLVGFPDAMDHRRLARIARRAVIKLPAEVDDLHARIPLSFAKALASYFDALSSREPDSTSLENAIRTGCPGTNRRRLIRPCGRAASRAWLRGWRHR